MIKEMWLPYEEAPLIDLNSDDEDIEAYVGYQRSEFEREWQSYNNLYRSRELRSDEVARMIERGDLL